VAAAAKEAAAAASAVEAAAAAEEPAAAQETKEVDALAQTGSALDPSPAPPCPLQLPPLPRNRSNQSTSIQPARHSLLVPTRSGACTDKCLVPWGAVLPRPLHHLQVSVIRGEGTPSSVPHGQSCLPRPLQNPKVSGRSGDAHVMTPHGQSCSLAHFSSRCPPRAASLHVSSPHGAWSSRAH